MTNVPDTELELLLKNAGANLGVAELDSLIAGVLAAPGTDGGNGGPNAWMGMVAADPAPELLDALRQRLADAATSYETGLVSPCPSAERLEALRTELNRRKLDGFIIPLADEHQGEYIPKRAQRLAWLTGFTGSAGTAIVLKDKAAVFVDGRYTLQADDQVDASQFEIVPLAGKTPAAWLTEHAKAGEEIGYDPWLHTPAETRRLEDAATKTEATLCAVEANPVDAIWDNQPDAPLSPAHVLTPGFAGLPSREKRAKVSDLLSEARQDAVVLTAPDSIAWLLNIRGGDVPYTPFCLAFGILHQNGRFDLYTDLRKIPPATAEQLPAGVEPHPKDSFIDGLTALGKAKASVRIDPASAAKAISLHLQQSGAAVRHGDDPCQLPKACKNETELKGIRAAHERDGKALTRFLAWLSREGTSGSVSEMSAADQLEAFRREGDNIQGLSFPTISGAGPNGAIVHYRVTEQSNRRLEQNSLYLVDSGAQYLDGTTDVTRTIAIGTPSAEMKDRFTRVLKGHIALATAVFPPGTSGSQLDALARVALWQVGLDYDHGTGHGVGHYLGVHEGPHRISKAPNTAALKPGMIVSNEPGYYKTDAYGIRIENLVAVREASFSNDAEREMLCFETLTLAPIDINLVVAELLSEAEKDWLDAYHRRVYEALADVLDDQERDWLETATAPVQ